MSYRGICAFVDAERTRRRATKEQWTLFLHFCHGCVFCGKAEGGSSGHCFRCHGPLIPPMVVQERGRRVCCGDTECHHVVQVRRELRRRVNVSWGGVHCPKPTLFDRKGTTGRRYWQCAGESSEDRGILTFPLPSHPAVESLGQIGSERCRNWVREDVATVGFVCRVCVCLNVVCVIAKRERQRTKERPLGRRECGFSVEVLPRTRRNEPNQTKRNWPTGTVPAPGSVTLVSC